MGKGQDTNPIARREAIEACVRRWIQKNPEEFTKFVEFVKDKRKKMIDPVYGRTKGTEHTFQEGDRLQGHLPPSLSRAINELCRWHQQGSLFAHGTDADRKKEGEWFFNKFSVFRVVEKL
jgi:hypothetical protein